MTPSEPPSGSVSPQPQCIWLAFEAPEVIELKRVVLDRDAMEAADFFQRVIVARVLAAAQQRGIHVALDNGAEHDECLPG
ncbi:MAG: hypothetical protein M1546_04495 [Chloroflexi bacterium]|nr:hypothetical protein [Chloroflexota bacterium]